MKRFKITNSGTDEITCPWCGCEFEDSHLCLEDLPLVCPECEKVFRFTKREVYDTLRDCEDNYAGHDWKVMRGGPGESTMSLCRACDRSLYKSRGDVLLRWQI